MSVSHRSTLGHRFRTLACTACLAITTTAGVAAHAADACGNILADPAATTSQRMLDALVATNGVPGMGASLWRSGDIVWTGCSGRRDVAADLPVRHDTVFRLASVSKAITATAVAKLSEEGRVDLDAPVTAMLPWLKNGWQPVSVRQLAAHTSGLPHYQAIDADLGGVHYATARDAVGIFAGRSLLARPGTSYEYSSWGYTLIGAVIEAQSGQSFLDYIATQVTPGLRIQADSSGRGPDASHLYEIGNGTPRLLPLRDFSYTWPGGGLAATPEALARFGGSVLHGQVVSASTWRSMLQPARLHTGDPVRERDYHVGLGWRVGADVDGARIAHHAGVTDGARSALVLWPEEDSAASVLSNASWVSSIESTAILLAAPFRPRPPGLQSVMCPVRSNRYGGYLGKRSIEGVATFRLEHGRCVGELTTGDVLDKHFAAATAWPGRKLQVIALEANGSLARAALVTPFGLYDLRAEGPGRWSAALAAGTRLELQL